MPAVQAAGQTLPDATPHLGKIPLFTKIAVTFDPVDSPNKLKHSLCYD